MSYETYKLIHIFSLLLLFFSLGALLMGKDHKKPLMIFHGLAIVAILVSGFGLLARLQLGTFPTWVTLKLVIWGLLGFVIPVLISRFRHSQKGQKALLVLILGSGFFGALLAVLKLFA